MNYSLKAIASVTRGQLAGADMTVRSVTTDSRSANDPAGVLFVALRGAHRDGHEYIDAQYRKGVRAFLVESKPEPDAYPGAGFVVCGDTLEALQTLAAHHRNRFTGKIIAITGSNGKTVTKEWIAQLCPADLKLFRSPKSYNSQIGVPLSLLMLSGDEDLAVIEAGMSRPGEMERLEAIIRPDIGILTNIGDAHQENFPSLGEKLQDKLSLFARAETIIYNNSDPLIDGTVRELFSDRRLFPVNADMYDLHDLPMQDQASRDNVSEAVGLFDVLGYLPGDITANLNQLQGVAMRLELKGGVGESIIVNDSYNSDINSLAIALDYLGTVSGGREKVLILSDIYQSGLSPDALYTEVARLVQTKGIDRLIGIGDVISHYAGLFSGRRNTFYGTTADFLTQHNRSAFTNQAVLIKGSRPFQFERVSRALERKIHTTVLEVNLDHMIHNLNYFRGMLRPGVQTMAMVKAMGYGSGVYEVANVLQNQGVGFLAVAFADEGIALREAGITMPLVVLNADSDSFDLMIEYRLEPEIYSFSSLASFADALRRQGETGYPIHIKLDTGMHRLGFMEHEMDALVGALIETSKTRNSLFVRTVFSHLAVSDDPSEDDFTHRQIALFGRMSDKIRAAFPELPILRHIANSAGIERFPASQFDMVRLGIGLYGLSVEHQEHLKVVSTLRSRIVQIKELAPGETVGYGRHGKILRQSRTATVPIGYADGLDRHLSRGNWWFEINGRRAPIIGNICMDTCMVDITDVECAEGDAVTIFGESPGVIAMAQQLDTIPYEILTGISSRVKRVYTKE